MSGHVSKDAEEDGSSYVFTADGLDDIVWGCSQKLGNDGKLVHVVLAGEQRLALEHFCENAASTPDIDLHIVLLPREHDLGCSVVARRDISSHLRILYTREAEIANLQIAVLVDEDVAGLQISVNNTRGVDVFETTLLGSVDFLRPKIATYENLVEEVLDELLLERSRGE